MPITFNLVGDGIPDGVRVLEAHGSEGMNVLSRWELETIADEPLDMEPLIGSSATLAITDDWEGDVRQIPLAIHEVGYLGWREDGHVYGWTLVDPLHFLSLRSNHRIFLAKTTIDILRQIVVDAGMPGDMIVTRLSGSYLVRPQTIQYGESDWSFCERLLAEDGIAWWFDTRDGAPTMVCADDVASHAGVDGSTKLPFRDPSGMVSVRSCHELELTARVCVGATYVADWDPRMPDVPIVGSAGEGPFEWYEHPANVPTKDHAKARALARLQQLRRLARHAHASTDAVRLAPGRLVELTDCADEAANRTYLIATIEHQHATTSWLPGEHAGEYSNRVLLVPREEQTFRPDVPLSAPRIPWVETAVTTGPAGEEIHVDDMGSLKLRFPWDRAGITDDKSSEWARCLQMAMGGLMVLPRVGWEVPVAYVEGNPDRPFVLGRMYNATAVLPYGLPAKAASTAFQSATSPGGGSTNEIRMGDSGGSQQLFIHASKDQTVTVGGTSTSKIGANETHDVGLGLRVAIAGSQTTTIAAKQDADVVGDVSTALKGSRTETIGGAENNKITANRTVEAAGSYMELIGALYGIQCNQANYTIKGAFTQLIGAAQSTSAAMNHGESVAAARSELVGAAHLTNASKGFTEKVTGAKTITAGPTRERADGKIVTQVTGAASVSAASGRLVASSKLGVEAPTISIDVSGSIKAEGLKLSGGFKVSAGSAALKGTIKRESGGKVEG